MALLLHTLLLFLSISVSSQELQNEKNITNNASAEACQGNCNTVYSSPPPPYQSLPIYTPPPPSSGQGSQPQCPPCCQNGPPQPYYYPPQPYLTPQPPGSGYQPYYNYSGTSCLVFYDGFLLGLCFLLLGAFV